MTLFPCYFPDSIYGDGDGDVDGYFLQELPSPHSRIFTTCSCLVLPFRDAHPFLEAQDLPSSRNDSLLSSSSPHQSSLRTTSTQIHHKSQLPPYFVDHQALTQLDLNDRTTLSPFIAVHLLDCNRKLDSRHPSRSTTLNYRPKRSSIGKILSSFFLEFVDNDFSISC